jgi:hypothetical protein
MTFARRNRLTTHISEHITVFTRPISVHNRKNMALCVSASHYLSVPLTVLAISFTALTFLAKNDEIHVFKRITTVLEL